MRNLLLLFVLVVVLGGCNQSHVSSAPWRSGSRLRAIVERTDDGLTRFVTWHDTELDVDCRFAYDVEGTLRCMPLATVQGGYLDSACATPGHAESVCNPTRDRYLSRYAPRADTCSPVLTFEAVEIDLDAGRDGVFDMLSGSCAASTSATRVYPILGTVDPARFVAAAVEVRPLTARASVEVYVAADGSEQMSTRIHDAELASDCWFVDGEADAPCVPVASALVPADASFVTPYFADAACTEQVASGGSAECGGEPLLARTFSIGCAPSTALYELGAPYTGRAYARQPDGTCSETTAASTLYEVGPAYDTRRLMQGARAVRGEGAVRLRTLELEGHALEHSRFVDPSGQPCWTYTFLDGSMRCVVVDVVITSFYEFADPSCTEAVVSWSPSECSPDPWTRAAVIGAPASCLGGSDAISVHDVTPIAPGPRYRMESGACVESRVDEERSYYRLSAPLPVDTLPRITRAME